MKGSYIKVEDLVISSKITKQKKRKILSRLFELVFEDLIENNVHFQLPKYSNSCSYLYIETVDQENFKEIYKKGGFRNIDWLTTNFQTYLPKFRYEGLSYTRIFPVYIGGKLQTRLVELINSGKIY